MGPWQPCSSSLARACRPVTVLRSDEVHGHAMMDRPHGAAGSLAAGHTAAALDEKSNAPASFCATPIPHIVARGHKTRAGTRAVAHEGGRHADLYIQRCRATGEGSRHKWCVQYPSGVGWMNGKGGAGQLASCRTQSAAGPGRLGRWRGEHRSLCIAGGGAGRMLACACAMHSRRTVRGRVVLAARRAAQGASQL